MKPKEYKIETLSDISNIPAESREDFFVDLKSWLELVDGINLANSLLGCEAIAPPNHINWIDDGEHDMTLQFKVKGDA